MEKSTPRFVSSSALAFCALLALPTGCADERGDPEEFRHGNAKGHGHGCDAPSIELPGNALFPEGVSVDRDTDTLYVGGMGNGSVVAARPCDGAASVVAAAGTFRNIVGVQWDHERGALWVCNSDLSFSSPPSLDLLDVDGGEVLARHDFGAVGFCNDVAFDHDGNVFATDSLGHRVVRVAAADGFDDTPVETWAAPSAFNAGADFSLNGLAFTSKRRLVVANIPTGSLFAVDVDKHGDFAGVADIELDASLAGPDGLYAVNPHTLILVESGTHRISQIDLAPDGLSGSLSVIEDDLSFPTTAAMLHGSAWVLEGELDHLFGFNPNPPDLPFTLVNVAL